MSKELIIVESPTKARTITRMLTGSYHITSSKGHIRDLPSRRLAIDIENQFTPEYEITASRAAVIKELKAAVKKADAVYLATDPDREGEAIAWHIYEVLKDVNKKAVFHRVTFHEITKTAVQHALDNPTQLDMHRVDAQQARRVIDRIVGYKVSKLLWRQVERGTSAGRVQSVALRLICEREKLILDFEPQEYWNLVGRFLKSATGEGFDTKLAEVDGKKTDVTSAEQAEALATDAERGAYQVSNVKRQPRKRRPSPPFITSTLQQAASSNIRMSPQQTMRVAQELYEGVDTGSGPGGLITYMRTDSVNVAKEAQNSARSFIGSEFGQDYVPAKPNYYKSRSSAQEAHEAIRPTDVTLTPAKAARYLDDRQAKLYRLIWNRFVASQMAPADELRTTVELTNTGAVHVPNPCKHKFLFRATSTIVTFPGFLKVYNLSDTEEEGEKEGTLPELAKDDACSLKALDREQKFTEPPARFSEATLVRELEKNGVGRPSTYASIVNTIQQRKYVEKEKGRLAPTKLGFTVNDYLVGSMPKLFDVTFTAQMEDQLDTVEGGGLEWHQMLDTFYTRFADWLATAKDEGKPDEAATNTLLEAFPEDVPWEKPVKLGKKTYDDHKFLNSLKDDVKKGKAFSARQWGALMALAIKYEKHLPPLDSLVTSDDDKALLAKCREEFEKRNSAEPDPEVTKILDAMAGIKTWEDPVTRGKRTYDDHAFYESLKEQVASGRKLTPNQSKALKKILVKYTDQIANMDEIRAEIELPTATAKADAESTQIDGLLALASEIKEYEAPRKRGRRTYDDKDFIESIRGQHEQGRTLSQPQWSALQTVVAKYTEQIENFADRAKELGLSASGKEAPTPTNVTCPQCNEGKLQQRRSRRGVFYGCEKYPKCKYATNSLDELKPPTKAK